MRVVALVFAASTVTLAASVPAAAFAPGGLGASVNAAVGDVGSVVEAKVLPPGWHHGLKRGWRGHGMPPGQLKKHRS